MLLSPKAKGRSVGFLIGMNPKNLLMGVAAGVAIGTTTLGVGESAVGIVTFMVIAASSVALPVIAHLVASTRMHAPLENLRGWLEHNNATVMAVLLVVIGVAVVGKGIGSF